METYGNVSCSKQTQILVQNNISLFHCPSILYVLGKKPVFNNASLDSIIVIWMKIGWVIYLACTSPP